MIPKSGNRFRQPDSRRPASAGEGRSEKHALGLDPRDHAQFNNCRGGDRQGARANSPHLDACRACARPPEWTMLLSSARERSPRVSRCPDRRKPGQPRPAQRALARDLPPDRRELSRDRRAGRLAQSFTPDHDAALAGLRAQRDGGPRAAWPDLRAAHLRRPAADGVGPALLRRRAHADRRPQRKRPAHDRGAGRRRRQVGGERAHRSLRPAVRPHARRRRRAHRQDQRAAQAYRVRPSRARACAGRAGRRGRPGRKPRRSTADRAADLRAHRGDELSQRAHPRQDSRRGQGRARTRAGSKPRRARRAHPEDRRSRASRAGRAGPATSAG